MSTPRLEPAALPIMTIPPAAVTSAESRERDRLIRRAKALSWLSLAYMTVEGAVGITPRSSPARSRCSARPGLRDEGLASIIVISASPARAASPSSPSNALSGSLRSRSSCSLRTSPGRDADADRRRAAKRGLAGIGLSISSSEVMPLLGKAKRHLGERLGSGATASEGAQNLLLPTSPPASSPAWLSTPALGWSWPTPTVRSGSPRAHCAKARTWQGEGSAPGSDPRRLPRRLLRLTTRPPPTATNTLTRPAGRSRRHRRRRAASPPSGTFRTSFARRTSGPF